MKRFDIEKLDGYVEFVVYWVGAQFESGVEPPHSESSVPHVIRKGIKLRSLSRKDIGIRVADGQEAVGKVVQPDSDLPEPVCELFKHFVKIILAGQM
jgi:hypothetical protein